MTRFFLACLDMILVVAKIVAMIAASIVALTLTTNAALAARLRWVVSGVEDSISHPCKDERRGKARGDPSLPHVVVTGGGRNQNPNDAPSTKRCGAGIGAMRGRGGRDDRI